MRALVRLISTLALSLAAFATLASSASAQLCPGLVGNKVLGAVVPAYFYPTIWDPASAGAKNWALLTTKARLARAQGVPFVVVFNPSNGAFTTADPNYQTVVRNLKAAGATVVGYLYTSGGTRPAAEISTNMSAYKSFYPQVDGFFFDEVANVGAASKFAYYRGLVATATTRLGKTPFTVGNPGAVPDASGYQSIFNVTVVFENSGSAFPTVSIPSWIRTGDPARFAYIVHTSNTLPAASEQARSCRIGGDLRYANPVVKNGGWWFVTNDVYSTAGANPYDTLGTQFSGFVTTTCWINTGALCQ